MARELVGKEETGLLVSPVLLGIVHLSGSEQTLTLPKASESKGKFLIFKNTAAVTTTIDGYGSETIDGQTSIALYDQYEVARLYCDGSTWHII